jgi:hypothetical protein
MSVYDRCDQKSSETVLKRSETVRNAQVLHNERSETNAKSRSRFKNCKKL